MKFRINSTERRAIRWALTKKSPWTVDGRQSSFRGHANAKIIKSLKDRLKLHHMRVQDSACCYCKVSLHNRNIETDREHIIPRSVMPGLTFAAFNLSVACKSCNMSVKLVNKNHIRNWRRKNRLFSKNISDQRNYNIVHPNIHHWHDHIELYAAEVGASKVRIYYPITYRGKFTYKFFQLKNYEIYDNTLAQKAVRSNRKPLHPGVVAAAAKYHQI
ncbi:HNH endonuclease [Sphingomonas parapaucimobilis]|uniref:HNH endonuclease n=1 Tax=Sphingomonas parapaucimobilis TaxID=28213 RepID=UPI0012ECD2C3|nr:hypothetical protein [Sphingomonas parapaucimobilis]